MDRAWGWVGHLRTGGTTPWREWRDAGPATGPALPGAQHLEVLRRINLLAPAPAALADAVLATRPAGRGQQELDLVGAGRVAGSGRAFGPPPVDPAEIGVGELLRVATGALADLAAATSRRRPAWPVPGPESDGLAGAPARRRARLPRSYRLIGDPLLVAGYEGQLRAQGRPPARRAWLARRHVLVLADAATMLGDAWTVAARHGDGPTWPAWLRQVSGGGRPGRAGPPLPVPPRPRSPGRRVVAFEAAEVEHALPLPVPLREPLRLSHAAVHVSRRVSAVLRSMFEADRRRALVDEVLLPWLAEADPRGPAPGVPRRYRPWLRGEARRLRDRAVRAGYRVADDDWQRLRPAPPRAAGVDEGEVLAVMLRTLQVGAREPAPRTVDR